MRFIAVSLVAVAALACSKSKPASTTPPPPLTDKPAGDPPPDTAAPPPAATPSDAELAPMFEETLVFIEALATAVDGAGSDCGKMAVAINGVIDAHQPLLAKAKTYSGNHEVDEKANAFMNAHKDRVEAATAKLAPGMGACSDDPQVQAAMAKFDEM